MLGLWAIIKACLLLTNAGAVLHETRLLPRLGIPHAGAQPGSKRQRASPLASRGELLAIQNSAYSLGFKLGFQALVQPPPTPAAASSGAAAFAPPRAPRFAADRPS